MNLRRLTVAVALISSLAMSFAPQTASATAVQVADGADVAQGALADAACATDNGSCSVAAILKRIAQRLTTLNTTSGSPMQATGGTVGLVAGVAIVGKFGVDQTTPGTTDSVSQKVQAPSASYVAQQGDGLGKAINTPFADAASSWYDVRAGVTAATFAVKAASGVGVRNYVTGIQICGVSSTVATRLSIKDGSTDMADFEVAAGASCQSHSFNPPLRGTANTITNVNTNAAGPVTFNTQGFTAAN